MNDNIKDRLTMMLIRGRPLSNSSGELTGDMNGSLRVISASSNVAMTSSISASISSSESVSSLEGTFIPNLKPGDLCLGKNGD